MDMPKMLGLSYKIEKEKQVNPQGIHKMPKNSSQSESQMIRRGVFFLHILNEHGEEHNDANKNMKQMGSRNHV